MNNNTALRRRIHSIGFSSPVFVTFIDTQRKGFPVAKMQNQYAAVMGSALLAVSSLFSGASLAADTDWVSTNKRCGDPETSGNHVYCSVPVPNGNFAGLASPAGNETGDFWHPWEPYFSWTRLDAVHEHPVLEHIAPWQLHGNGTVSYPLKGDSRPGVALSQPMVAIWQEIDVPPEDGTQGSETTFLLKVTYRTEAPSAKPVGMAVRLYFGDGEAFPVSQAFFDSQSGTKQVPASFVVTMRVPAHTAFSRAAIGIWKTDGEASLVIEDVQMIQDRWGGLFD